jgi:hypothetical protein
MVTEFQTTGGISAATDAGDRVLEEFLDAVDGIAYAVDAEYRIVAVGRRRWERFAIESGAPELRADKIIGRNLFELMTGPELHEAYRDLADRILSTGEPAVIATRRDSPGVVRELRLSIAPLPLGEKGPGLLFQVQIVSETGRPRLDVFDLKALLSALKQEADLPIVTMCSYCEQLRRPGSGPGSGDEEWITAETYYRLGGSSRVRISHGLCADCDAARFSDL